MLLSRPIEGSRLSLRTLETGADLTPYLAWLGDPHVNRYLESRFQEHSEHTARTYIEKQNSSSNVLLLGIFLNDGARHIGNIKLGPIDAVHRRAAIGIMIGERDQWGRGYGAEAIGLLAGYAFETLGLHKLVAGFYEDNEASVAAFAKAGFVEEARLERHWWCDGRWQDGVIMALINDEEPA